MAISGHAKPLRWRQRRFLPQLPQMDTLGHYAPGCSPSCCPRLDLPMRPVTTLREGFSEYSPLTQQEHMTFTLSVGITQATEKDDSIMLLERAEAALDAVDRRGGNRAYG